MLLNTKELNKRFQFLSIWFVATLYATLLSNRPYPHYFIQMVPPFSLLIIEIASQLTKKAKTLKNNYKSISTGFALIALTLFVMLTLGFKPYPVVKYYDQFWQMISGQITKSEYDFAFNNLMKTIKN